MRLPQCPSFSSGASPATIPYRWSQGGICYWVMCSVPGSTQASVFTAMRKLRDQEQPWCAARYPLLQRSCFWDKSRAPPSPVMHPEVSVSWFYGDKQAWDDSPLLPFLCLFASQLSTKHPMESGSNHGFPFPTRLLPQHLAGLLYVQNRPSSTSLQDEPCQHAGVPGGAG